MKNTETIMRLEGYVDRRSIVINPMFSQGYSVGWRFAVPEAFKDALDIKLTSRRCKAGNLSVLTQGKNYSFSANDTIYDTPKAYKMWKEALKEFKYCVEIQEAVPARNIQTKVFKTCDPVNYKEDGKTSNRRALFIFERTRTDYGHVKFKILTPDQAKGKLELQGVYETDQEKFVYFLQTGKLITNDDDFIEF